MPMKVRLPIFVAAAVIFSGAISAVFAQQPAKYTLEDRIEFRLETSATLKKYNLGADVDDKGVATLTGDVATNAQKMEAEKLAKIEGIVRVQNDIDVDPNEDKTLADRAKAGLNRAGEKISDAWIMTKVKWFFLGEDLLAGSNINVDVNDRIVTLKGTVKTDAGKRRAVELTQNVDGVTKVNDQLTIGGSL